MQKVALQVGINLGSWTTITLRSIIIVILISSLTVSIGGSRSIALALRLAATRLVGTPLWGRRVAGFRGIAWGRAVGWLLVRRLLIRRLFI